MSHLKVTLDCMWREDAVLVPARATRWLFTEPSSYPRVTASGVPNGEVVAAEVIQPGSIL